MTRYANNEQYIMTCEGETEVWYFEHLKKLINAIPNKPKMNVVPVKETNPAKKAKSVVLPYKRVWYHIVDKETCQECDEKIFENRILSFKNIKKVNKTIEPFLGYSNVSFELWLILHKSIQKPSVHCAKDYWEYIKKLYKLDYVESFDDYKSERVFKQLLKQITLEDIRKAIKRAEELENINEREGILRTKGFSYYDNNPSMSVHNVVKQILLDSELL